MNSSSLIPVHMTLCGKGGVGKSVIARMLTEYLTDRSGAPLAFDTDPVNTSFASVQAFNVTRVNLIDDDQKIDASRFDQMVLAIVEAGRPSVIDTGASSYVALLNYMRELKLAETFRDEGHELFLHLPIAGGPSLAFTVENLSQVCQHHGHKAGIVVWLNHYWERIAAKDGAEFSQWRVFEEYRHAIRAVLSIQRMSSDTSAADFSALLKDNVTFSEALKKDSQFHLLSRSRLRRIRETLFQCMDESFEEIGGEDDPAPLELEVAN